MSKGIGKTQQAILDTLKDSSYFAEPIGELAKATGKSPRQVRTAVHALESRGEVIITKGFLYRRGVGEYGHLVRRQYRSGQASKNAPAALTVKKGEPWPRGVWTVGADVDENWNAKHDQEWIHQGMPTSALVIWLPVNREKYLAERAAPSPVDADAAEWGALMSGQG